MHPSTEARFLAGGGESGARLRAVDWSRTALGPPQHWPRSLKTMVRMMLDSRYAMWMLWGPELTFFCNDAYLPTVGIRRDWVMGARSDKVWAEIWPDIWPRIEQVLTRGESTWDEALQLFLERSGFPEETYHTFSYSPVYDDDSRIAGMLCVVTEVTERVLGERGLTLLRDLATRTQGASTVQRVSGAAHERAAASAAGRAVRLAVPHRRATRLARRSARSSDRCPRRCESRNLRWMRPREMPWRRAARWPAAHPRSGARRGGSGLAPVARHGDTRGGAARPGRQGAGGRIADHGRIAAPQARRQLPAILRTGRRPVRLGDRRRAGL